MLRLGAGHPGMAPGKTLIGAAVPLSILFLTALRLCTLTPSERRLRGQAAVEQSWANTTDRSARTQPARDALFAKFAAEVDPDGVLDPGERQRRAQHAFKSHMARLSLAASKAKRTKAAARKGAS